MKIEKQVFNEMIQKNLDEIRKINEQKEKEYQWETKYSTFEYSAKLWFLSVENLLFIRWIWDKINRLASLHRKNFENSVSWETVFDTCNDLINYSALLADYLISKDWTSYNKIFDEVAKIFENKNWDYSNTQDDAIANFNEIENLWLWKTEDWMLARIAIKVQRIANFLRNWEKNERFYDEIIDLIIYTLIFSNYLKYKMWNTSNLEAKQVELKQEEVKQSKQEEPKQEPETIKTDIENAFENKIEEKKEIKEQKEEQNFKEDVKDKDDLDKIIEREVNDINTKIIEEQIIESAPSKKTEEIIEKDNKIKKERKSKKVEEKQEEIILDFDVDDIMKNVTNEVNTEVEEKIQKNNEIKQQEQVSQETENEEENPFDKQSWEEKLNFIWNFL